MPLRRSQRVWADQPAAIPPSLASGSGAILGRTSWSGATTPDGNPAGSRIGFASMRSGELNSVGRAVGILAVSAAVLASFAGRSSAGAASSMPWSDSSCIEAGLARPGVVEATMSHPGDHYTQSMLLEFWLRESPAGCQELFAVPQPHYQFQLQDHLHHARWIPLNPFRPTWSSPRRHGNLFAYWGIQKGHGPKKPMSRQRLYQCSPGNAITKVRVLLKQRVVNRETDQTVDSKTITVPVKVKWVRAKLKHRGALRGPC